MRLVAFLVTGLCLALPAAAGQRAGDHSAAPAPASEIDHLFAALKNAGSEEDAKPIEDKIAAAFLRSGSATVDL